LMDCPSSSTAASPGTPKVSNREKGLKACACAKRLLSDLMIIPVSGTVGQKQDVAWNWMATAK